MTPQQRAAALRLADALYNGPYTLRNVVDAAALLRELAQEPQAEPAAHHELAEQCAVYAQRIMELEKALGECSGALELVGHPIEWAHPPQRKPLTDERIAEMVCEEQFLLVCDDLAAITDITRAVERLHGIPEAP